MHTDVIARFLWVFCIPKPYETSQFHGQPMDIYSFFFQNLQGRANRDNTTYIRYENFDNVEESRNLQKKTTSYEFDISNRK